MILDSLGNAALYAGIGERLATAFDFLSETDFSSVPDGKIELNGDNLFAIAQTYQTRLLEDSKWEAHRKYIDIQFLLAGTERIGVAKGDSLNVVTKYNSDADCVILKGDGDMLTLSTGDFAILFPWDAHMPGVACDDAPSEVRKIVVKVKLEN